MFAFLSSVRTFLAQRLSSHRFRLPCLLTDLRRDLGTRDQGKMSRKDPRKYKRVGGSRVGPAGGSSSGGKKKK